MKVCQKCNTVYGDDYNFCLKCGGPLTVQPQSSQNTATVTSTKRMLVVGLVIALALICGAILFSEYSAYQEQSEAIKQEQLEKYLAEPKTYDILITSWDHSRDGDYITITGTVKNISDKDISYYEVGISFMDSLGNVLDTDWTNGSDVGPGESQEFSTMHSYSSDYDKIKVYIKEVY
jgi:hypothetical protein